MIEFAIYFGSAIALAVAFFALNALHKRWAWRSAAREVAALNYRGHIPPYPLPPRPAPPPREPNMKAMG